MTTEIDNQTKQIHDHVMASEPFDYRGYMIKPVSHRVQPHWIAETRSFAYWGWSVFDHHGTQVAPGATWGRSPMQTMDIVDCMLATDQDRGNTADDFWAAMAVKNAARAL